LANVERVTSDISFCVLGCDRRRTNLQKSHFERRAKEN